MKKFLLSLLLVSLSSASSNAGLKNRITPRASSVLQGVGIIGHLGLNTMFAYFEIEQMKLLSNIPYIDNEKGVAEKDKTCGPLCQENSRFIRNNVMFANNVESLAIITSILSGIFNLEALCIWSAMQAHWDQRGIYVGNVQKLIRISLGISVVNSFLNIFSTSLMADTLLHHVEEVTLRTLAPLQVAVMTGTGYWLPTILFAGYGLVKIAETLDAGRALLNKGAEFLEASSNTLPMRDPS